MDSTSGQELKRQKQIEEIEGDSFTQQEFRTVGYKPEKKDDSRDGFDFGTEAEVSKKNETKTKLEQLNSEGLINPTLFGNQKVVYDPDTSSSSEEEEEEEDAEDEVSEEQKQLDEAERKRREIAKLAEIWTNNQEESKRKHKSLALIVEAKEEEKMRKNELNERKWGATMEKARKSRWDIMPPEEKVEEKVEEENTWKQRWLLDEKIQQVYLSSKLLSKTKQKMKALDEDLRKRVEEEIEEEEMRKEEEKVKEEETQGVIGSIQEYASLVGKSVKQLADAKYEPPEESESEEESDADDEDGNLWGAIMGGD